MKKYPNIGKKCKIVCSSNIAKYLTKKVLKAFGLSNDINNIILKINSDKFTSMQISKKFDICLMNPPYGDSHLKFLETAIKISENVISIQPIRWLEDPMAKSNKRSDLKTYETSILKHIKNIEQISAVEATNTFDIVCTMNLGIYTCGNKGGYNYKPPTNTIVEKVVDYINKNLCPVEQNKKDGYRVRVSTIGQGKGGGNGDRGPQLLNVPIKDIVFFDGKYDGLPWYKLYRSNQYSKNTDYISASIKFNTEEEGHNFAQSFNTDFVRYVESFIISNVNITNNKILWMGNAINPRTKKPGYTTAWSDEDFNEFFNLTDDEILQYKKYISDFEKLREMWKKQK